MPLVRTAIFPVAGLGTRFLPATKAVPKELLPIVDRPLIQYAVDEALSAGIENLIFVTRPGSTSIEDHFRTDAALEAELAKKGADESIEMLRGLRGRGEFTFVEQSAPLGLGHAVLCARDQVGDEPFAVLLADDLLLPPGKAFTTMVDAHQGHDSNVVLVQEVPDDQTDRYGIITPAEGADGPVLVAAIEEKPEPGTARSNLAVIGRYILDAGMMDDLSETGAGSGGEIQLTDGISRSLARRGLQAVTLDGRRFDCGSNIGFIEANLAVALARDDIGERVADMIDDLP